MVEQSAGGSSSKPDDLHAVYSRRLAERNRQLEVWTKRDRQVADARLVVFVAAMVLGS